MRATCTGVGAPRLTGVRRSQPSAELVRLLPETTRVGGWGTAFAGIVEHSMPLPSRMFHVDADLGPGAGGRTDPRVQLLPGLLSGPGPHDRLQSLHVWSLVGPGVVFSGPTSDHGLPPGGLPDPRRAAVLALTAPAVNVSATSG